MSTVFNEGAHTGEFLIAAANGDRSMGTGTVKSGESVVTGQIMADDAGELVAITAVTDTPVAIMYDDVDASSAAVADQTTVERDATVLGSSLTYFTGATEANIIAMDAKLAILGIIVR